MRSGSSGAETIELPMQGRQADVLPETFDAEARTVEVVWSTGARVRRYSWWRDEVYDEELSLDPKHVRLDRLNNGAPFLNAHNQWSLGGVLGVIVDGSARIEKGRAVATIKLSAEEADQPIVRKIKDGIIRSISVGYNVRTFEIVKKEGEVPVYRAIDWEPAELSAVPIPADDGAKFRSKPQGATSPCTITEIRASAQPTVNKEEPMKTEQNQPAAESPAPASTTTEARAADPAAPAAIAPAKPETPAKQIAPVADIRAAVKAVRLDEAFALDLAEKGLSIDEVRAEILKKLADAGGAEIRNQITVGAPQIEGARGAVENALLHRFQPGVHKLTDDAREFRGLTLLELGRELVEKRGVKTRGLSKLDVAGLALGLDYRSGLHSTSDFPIILANVANKTLRAAYEAAPQTFRPWTKQANASDFKQITRAQLGDAPSLEKVNEGGTIKRGTIGESKEVYSLATYGKVVGFTRQALINDDLGAFTRLPMMWGRAAADLESDTVWGIVTTNGNMNDSVALFHATHGNLTGSGTAISVDALGVGRAAMRKQTGLGGRLLNIQPKYLLVPAAKETVAQQYTQATNVVYTKGSDTNPFANTLVPIAEPRLDVNSAVSWYLASDPAQIDTIEYAYLEGSEGVQLSSRVGFDVDGVEFKALLDFAAKAIDWRGLYKNAGA